jgi:ubiquinone/menaquinone biosynthesis C-methylase UbiE
MVERVLEPEVMDSEQDAAEYAAFDNTAVNEDFVECVLAVAPKTGTVLDVGTGPGEIAVLLARRAPGLRIVAIDLGEHMLALAKTNVERAGLADRVEIARADAKATDFAPGTFDLVISNSLVHHIPEPELFFQEMKRVARPGAAFFIRDLHRPATESEHADLVETYAKGCSAYQRRTFAESLRAGLTVAEVQAICSSLDLPGLEVRRCSDRHWCAERRALARA